MSITIKLGTFSKRINSTKQPTLSGFTDFDCVLKDTTSVDNPTFLISAADLEGYNYASWGTRYYFVSALRSIRNNLWEVDCSLDVLATYKSNILATTAYVIYDTVSNTELPDNRLPIKTTKSISVSTAACPFVPDGGCFILSLTGSNGSTGVYKATQGQLAALIDDVSDIWDNLFNYPDAPDKPDVPEYDEFDFTKNIALALQYWADDFMWYVEYIKRAICQFFGSGDLAQNIRECRYIPFNVGVTGGSTTIYLGTFETQQSLGKLNTETVHRTASVSIPWQANDFRRRSPYTEVYLYLPYIGMIKLSSENLVGQSSISVAYTLALRDGSLICTVSSGGEILGQYSGNVGASVPIGVSNINLPKAAQSVVAGAQSAVNKNLGGVGMAVLNFADAVTPNFSSIGGLDGIAGIGANQNITCYTVFHDTVVAPNSELLTIGSPTMAPKALATLTGFCQCMDAHVEAPAMDNELEAIDNYLNSGFFIE